MVSGKLKVSQTIILFLKKKKEKEKEKEKTSDLVLSCICEYRPTGKKKNGGKTHSISWDKFVLINLA